MKTLSFLAIILMATTGSAMAWENCGDHDDLIGERVELEVTRNMTVDEYKAYLAIAMYDEYFIDHFYEDHLE